MLLNLLCFIHLYFLKKKKKTYYKPGVAFNVSVHNIPSFRLKISDSSPALGVMGPDGYMHQQI